MNKTSKTIGTEFISYAGGTPSRANPNFFNGTIPWVKSTECNSREINHTEEFISELALIKSSAKLVPPNSVLVAMYGATAGQISFLNIKATTNQAVLSILPNEKWDPKFIYYWLNFCKEKLIFLAQGSGQPNLNKSIVDSMDLPDLGIDEQKKISQILFSIDEQIEATKKLVEKKALIAEGLLRDLLIKNQTKNWTNKTLRDIFTICYGKDHKNIKDGDYPVLGTGGVMRYCSSYLYDSPSVLIGRKGSIDKTQYIETPFWTVDTLFYTQIHDGYDPYFVYLLTKIIDFRSLNEATGVPSLNTESIYRVGVSVPINIEEQKKISQVMKSLFAGLINEQAYLSKLEKEKQGLMQDLLTERISVN